jgi:hypothetical protein
MSKIHTVIPAIMAEVGAIEKGRRNTQQGYAFRGIDDAYAAFQPLFAKHGLFVVPTVLERIREERKTVKENGREGVLIYTTLTVRHTFTADDGSFVEAVTIGEAMDSGDKSSNKAMSAAMKYALLEVFCVPTEDDNDTENHSHEPRATAKPVGGSAANPTPPARTAPTPRPTALAVTEAEIRSLYDRAKAAGADATRVPEVLATEFPYLKDAVGAVHLMALKRADYPLAQTICGTIKPAADAPAAAPAGGFREFWPEQEITSQTTIVVATIAAVSEPRKSEKTGKFGPHKIDVQADGQLFTVDTFDKSLAEICMASGDAIREVAFDETVNGRFTNRKLVGVR